MIAVQTHRKTRQMYFMIPPQTVVSNNTRRRKH